MTLSQPRKANGHAAAPTPHRSTIVRQALRRGDAALDEHSAKTLLHAYGVSIPRGLAIERLDQAGTAFEQLHPPVVAKALSRTPIHKTDVGAVKLRLETHEQLRAALQEIAEAAARYRYPLDGFLIEEMIAAGTEFVVGGTSDPRFGPIMMLGMGGVFVEVLHDVAFRICPITEPDAQEMLGDLRCAPVLNGFRNHPPLPQEAILKVLLAIGGPSGLFVDLFDMIAEIDINPLIVTPTQAVAVDARFVLRGESNGR